MIQNYFKAISEIELVDFSDEAKIIFKNRGKNVDFYKSRAKFSRSVSLLLALALAACVESVRITSMISQRDRALIWKVQNFKLLIFQYNFWIMFQVSLFIKAENSA